MTERHLRCGADGCHFCCCCKNKHDRLGCLRRHVLWHLQNWFTLPFPPRKTIVLLDELEAWEDNEIEKNNQIKNEFEKKNENNDKNEDKETSSSCDGDKNEQNNENHNKATNPIVTAAGGARVPQNARLNLNVLEEHPSSVSKSKKSKSNQKKTKSNDGEKEVSAAVTNDGEKEVSAAVINDGEKEGSAAVIHDGEKEESAAVNKETKAKTKPKTANESNQENSLNEASKNKQQTKIVQENENLSQSFRKRKFVHEYVNLSFKKFKFVDLPDTEPPPAPTLHKLPSQLLDFTKGNKMHLHVGLSHSQVPFTSGAGTFSPYRRSFIKKKRKKKFRKYKLKFKAKFNKKYKYNYKYNNYNGAVSNFRVDTRLVASPTRIITDSFKVFDRGRHSGHAVPAGLQPPVHLPPRGEITEVTLRHSSPLHTTCSGITAALHQ